MLLVAYSTIFFFFLHHGNVRASRSFPLCVSIQKRPITNYRERAALREQRNPFSLPACRIVDRARSSSYMSERASERKNVRRDCKKYVYTYTRRTMVGIARKLAEIDIEQLVFILRTVIYMLVFRSIRKIIIRYSVKRAGSHNGKCSCDEHKYSGRCSMCENLTGARVRAFLSFTCEFWGSDFQRSRCFFFTSVMGRVRDDNRENEDRLSFLIAAYQHDTTMCE